MRRACMNSCVTSYYILLYSGILFDVQNILNGCWEEINCKEKLLRTLEEEEQKELFCIDCCKWETFSSHNEHHKMNIIYKNNEFREERGRMLRAKERKMKRIIIKHRHHKKDHSYICERMYYTASPYVISCIFPKRFPPITTMKNLVCTNTNDVCEM